MKGKQKGFFVILVAQVTNLCSHLSPVARKLVTGLMSRAVTQAYFCSNASIFVDFGHD